MVPPTISIVIPTYNRATFLKEAIESVRAQTFEHWELIVVDDGSTDATREIVVAFGDSRISYDHQENKGVAAARNRGVALSKGEYVAFLDSDDRWLAAKLEVQRAFFEKHRSAAICQTEEVWVRRGRRVNPRGKHQKHSGWIFRECLPLCIVSPSAVMLRRETFDALGGFDESFPACEDYDLWLRAALRYEIVTLTEPLIIKRGGHADQLSRQWGLDRWRIRALEKILADPLLPEADRPLVEAEIVRRSRIVAEGARKRGNSDIYREYSAKAEIGVLPK